YYLGVKQNRRWYLLMYVFIGLGFITKGPISAVIPAISIGGDILFRRDWQRLKSMHIVPGILIAAIPPAYWSWVLYQEFASYGPDFFLVIQSFGRFYKKMYDQKFNPLYFPLNFAWAFGIFILPLVYVCAGNVKRFLQGGLRRALPRFLSDVKANAFAGHDFVIPFWVFVTLTLISFSRYQLPQYIYWFLPAAALFSAGWIEERFFSVGAQESTQRTLHILSLIVPTVFVLIAVLIPIVSVDPAPAILWGLIPVALTLIALRTVPWQFAAPLATAALLYSVVNTALYPEIIKYQPAKAMAADIQRLEPGKEFVYVFGLSSSKRSYGLYGRRFTKSIYGPETFIKQVKAEKQRLVIVPEGYLEFFKGAILTDEVRMEIVTRYPSYKVATPSPKFLQKKKRAAMTKDVYLIMVSAIK
ncbi:MAG: glycosyltransferase family 39 protein, partial [Spirochaetia bacterium]|nr:glycosyltransferase family 39 protein [Spirochaetia bacterium]